MQDLLAERSAGSPLRAADSSSLSSRQNGKRIPETESSGFGAAELIFLKNIFLKNAFLKKNYCL